MTDLVTLAQVKRYIGGPALAGTTFDALLAALITGASAAIQNYLNRDLASIRRAETYDGTGSDTLTTHDYPVSQIHAVMVNGREIPQALKWGQCGWVQLKHGVAALGAEKFSKGLQNVVIDYTAGYSVIPDEIQLACIKLVASEFKRRDVINVASKGLAGESISYNADDVREAVKSLSSYQRVTP